MVSEGRSREIGGNSREACEARREDEGEGPAEHPSPSKKRSNIPDTVSNVVNVTETRRKRSAASPDRRHSAAEQEGHKAGTPEPNRTRQHPIGSLGREAVRKRNASIGSAGGAGGVEPGEATARRRRALAPFGLRRAPVGAGAAGGRFGPGGAPRRQGAMARVACSSRRAPRAYYPRACAVQ